MTLRPNFCSEMGLPHPRITIPLNPMRFRGIPRLWPEQICSRFEFLSESFCDGLSPSENVHNRVTHDPGLDTKWCRIITKNQPCIWVLAMQPACFSVFSIVVLRWATLEPSRTASQIKVAQNTPRLLDTSQLDWPSESTVGIPVGYGRFRWLWGDPRTCLWSFRMFSIISNDPSSLRPEHENPILSKNKVFKN